MGNCTFAFFQAASNENGLVFLSWAIGGCFFGYVKVYFNYLGFKSQGLYIDAVDLNEEYYSLFDDKEEIKENRKKDRGY